MTTLSTNKSDSYSMHQLSRGQEVSQSFPEKVYCAIWVMFLLYMIVRPVTNNELLIRLIWFPSLLFLVTISLPALKEEFCFEIWGLLFVLLVSFIGIGWEISQHILAIFMFLGSFVILRKAYWIKITEKTFNFISRMSVIISLLFFLYTFTPIAYRVHTKELGEWICQYYVFDLGNSNLAGMIIFCLYCIVLIATSAQKHKLPLIFILAIDLYMIIGTACRSALLGAILITVIYLFYHPPQVPKYVILLGVATPLLFMWIYIVAFNDDKLYNENISIMDKSLFSGRQNVYSDYLSLLDSWDKWLFGNIGEAGLANAHNISLSVLSSVGILGLVLFSVFYSLLLFKINKNSKSVLKTICIMVILTTFVQSSMESALFLGGFLSAIFIPTFILLSNYEVPVNSKSVSVRTTNQEPQ